MSTVVYFVELVVLSLIGIMVYRLYMAYKNWKIASAFSVKSLSKKSSVSALSVSTNSIVAQGNAKFISEPNNSDYLAADKISVTEADLNKPAHKSKHSSILDDYIGEFFSETESIDIEGYKNEVSTFPKSVVSKSVESKPIASMTVELVPSSLAEIPLKQESNAEEDYIKVESSKFSQLNVLPENTLPQRNLDSTEKNIPILKEFSDVEPDSFITVASANSEEENNHKVMSDKVVLAMLDEAKLVCAS